MSEVWPKAYTVAELIGVLERVEQLEHSLVATGNAAIQIKKADAYRALGNAFKDLQGVLMAELLPEPVDDTGGR